MNEIQKLDQTIQFFEADVTRMESVLLDTKRKLRERIAERSQLVLKQETDTRIAASGIPASTIELARQVHKRARQVSRLREANQLVESAYRILNAFMVTGQLPTWCINERWGPEERHLDLVDRLNDVIAPDNTVKGAELRRTVGKLYRELRERNYAKQA